jgi:hypothetical protein
VPTITRRPHAQRQMQAVNHREPNNWFLARARTRSAELLSVEVAPRQASA